MLFVVHVDYVIIPEIYHITIDDSFRSPRTPRRRRQGQSRPDDAIRNRRELRHFTWGLSWPWTTVFAVHVDYGMISPYSFTKEYYS